MISAPSITAEPEIDAVIALLDAWDGTRIEPALYAAELCDQILTRLTKKASDPVPELQTAAVLRVVSRVAAAVSKLAAAVKQSDDRGDGPGARRLDEARLRLQGLGSALANHAGRGVWR